MSCVARVVGVGGGADERDDRVDVVERDEVALEDVRAALRLAQLVLRAADDDLALEVEVVRDELEQRQRLRHAVDERDGVVAERRLQRRVLEQLVERDLRHRVALQLDLDAHAGAVGVVGEIGDLGEHLVLHEVGDLADDAGVAALLDAVRQLGDHDRRLAAAQLLDVRAGAHDDAAAAVRYASRMPARPTMYAPVGKSGPLMCFISPSTSMSGLSIIATTASIDLAEMVRRHVRRHADRDAGEPLTSRFGKRDGSTVGCRRDSS